MKIIILSLLLYFITQNTNAFNSDNNATFESKGNYWIGLGIGNCYFGPTICVNLSYSLNQHLFTIKYAKSDEFRFGVDASNFDNPSIGIKEYGILYGICYRESILLLSGSAGVSYLNGINRGKNIAYNNYEKLTISAVGFPFEVEAMFEFMHYVGIGILFYGNLNQEKIFGGGMLRIKIGSF